MSGMQLVKEKDLKLSGVRFFIIDECDKVLGAVGVFPFLPITPETPNAIAAPSITFWPPSKTFMPASHNSCSPSKHIAVPSLRICPLPPYLCPFQHSFGPSTHLCRPLGTPRASFQYICALFNTALRARAILVRW